MWKAVCMITETLPADWRDLQDQVARILRESGMEVETEKRVQLVRGAAEIDVHAVEENLGRQSIIFLECKYWQASVPQNVVHAFRSVVADGGANTGYVIASSAFQSGAQAAAGSTNVRLLTWLDFQAEFEAKWIEHYLRPQITEQLDEFMTMVEPLPPRQLNNLAGDDQKKFIKMRDKFAPLGFIAMNFTTYVGVLGGQPVPQLPLRARIKTETIPEVLTPELLDATGYREFLEVLVALCETAEQQLRAILELAE